MGYGPDLALAAAVRDYNGGAGPGSNPVDLDLHTTGGNYVAQVMAIALNCFH